MFNLRDYPWVWPPPGFIRQDKNGSEILAAASGLTFNLATFDIPTMMEGWITLAGIEMSSQGLPNPGVYFTLYQSSIPIRDYEQVTVPLGSPETPAALHIQVFPNQPVTLGAFNSSALNVGIRWRLYGWYYPRSQVGA